jgi:P-type Cu+ transporter
MENATLKLRGMNCASCANSIENAILAVSGVSQCIVNYGIEQATVTYDSGQTNLGAIQAAVEAAGYSAQTMQDQDLLTGEDDSEHRARNAESRDLTRKVWLGGIISVILVIGSLPMMTGLHLPFIPMWLHNF